MEMPRSFVPDQVPQANFFTAAADRLREASRSTIILIIGCAAVGIPTLLSVARESWSTEQGGHGMIVFVTGLWLLARQWSAAISLRRPASPAITSTAALVLLPAYFLARITSVIEVEGFVAYGLVLTALYSYAGAATMRKLAFPLVYLAFIFPPPETVVYALTLPMKIGIATGAVELLAALNYPVGSQGVTIQIGQYELLVAAACSGLNSIISLSALALFYIHVRNRSHRVVEVVLLALVVPIALFANFIRVLLLILITYYFGDAAAQGFLHNVSGVALFAIAMLAVAGCDLALKRLTRKRVTGNKV